MDQTEIKEKVIDYIRHNGAVSYVELERIFNECGYEWEGGVEVCSGVNENVVYWSGWTKEAFRIIEDLLQDGSITRESAHPLVYLIDGKGLILPKATKNRKYKTPHWLPIVFQIGGK